MVIKTKRGEALEKINNAVDVFIECKATTWIL